MPPVQVKRSMPSLIGGIFTAIVVFAIWLLLFGGGNPAAVTIGIVVAAVIGTWIRVADL